MRAVRSLLGEMRGIRLSWSCKEFVRRIARCLIELGVVRRIVRRNVRYLIELRAVRSLFGEMRGIR